MQMLWSRVISDGVRTMKSEVCSGIYTPEEQADIAGVDLPDQQMDTDDADTGEVIDANFELKGDCVPTNERSTDTVVVPPDGTVSEAEAEANAEGKTTHLQSEADIDRLAAERAAAAAKAAAEMPAKVEAMRGDGYVPGNGQQSANTNGKATKAQIDAARTLCKELAVPTERIAGMLAKSGVAKFSELPATHADKLLALLNAEKQRRTAKN
jgi:hypothetical protein